MTTQHDVPPASNPDDDRPHKPADDTEEVYFQGSPALRWQLAKGWGWVLAGLIIMAGPIGIKAGTTVQEPWWVIPIGLVVGLLVFFIPWIKTKTISYKVSNYRIDFERGLLGKKFDTLELWHVEDVQLAQSVGDRILGVGTITIHSNDDTTPHLLMRGLPHPKPLFDILKKRIIAVKRQRGVIKMDGGTSGDMDAGAGHHHG